MGTITPSFDANRTCLGKVFPLDTPFTVILDSSEVCNFRCNYCFRSNSDKSHWGYASRNDLMGWDIFEKAVFEIKKFPDNVRHVTVSNHGEPLCNPRLTEMVRYLRKELPDSRVSLHTNASLLDEKTALDLADADPGKIVVSLQGLDADAYLATCGAKVDFEKIIGSIALFYKHKKSTTLCVKIMDTALRDKKEEELFYKLFQPICDRVFVEREVKIWKSVDVENNGKPAYNKYGTEFTPQKTCPLIFHTVVVATNGDVYACTQIEGTKPIGNIMTSSLTDIWNSEERKRLLLDQLSKDFFPEECVNCGIKHNSIYSKEDMVDEYRDEIIERMNAKGKDFG